MGDADPTRVFVGKLPRHTTQEALSAYFSSTFGPVAKLDLKYDPEGGFKGFAFVTFADPSSAEAVFSNYSNNYFDSKWIDCQRTGAQKGGKGAQSPPLPPPPRYRSLNCIGRQTSTIAIRR